MNNGKGKGREDEAGNTKIESNAGRSEASSASMLNRVVNSTTGLARSLATADRNEVNERANTVLSNAGKGQTQNSGPSSSTWTDQRSISKPVGSGEQGIGQPSTLRSSRDLHTASAEAEFSDFLDGIESFQPSADFDMEPSSTIDTQIYSGSHALAQSIVNESELPLPQYMSVAEQEQHDGDDVLALLSQPTIAAETWDHDEAGDENVNWNLTSEQISMLRSLTNELFPPPQVHSPPQRDNAMNLIPDNGYFRSTEERDQWMKQWEGVLTRYTGEVWGDLMPLVDEARKEVENMKKARSDADEKPKALRRLGLILGHFQG